MIMLLLGLIDVLIAVEAVLLGYGHYISALIWAAAAYLILKGLLFIKSIASILDIIAGLLLVLALVVKLPMAVFWAIAIYLVQKGIFSFF